MFVAKPFLMQQFDTKAQKYLDDICILMHSYKHSFPNLYSLLVDAVIFDVTILESIIFDAVKNIDSILQVLDS